MKIASNKKGGKKFNMKNKPFERSNNGNRRSNKLTLINQKVNKDWQQGRNLVNPAANKPKKFGGNNDAESNHSEVKKRNIYAESNHSEVKKRNIDNDINSDEDLETSENDDEVEDKVNVKEEVKVETTNISNETSKSKDEADAGGSAKEVKVGVGNEGDTSTEEVEREDVLQQQKESRIKENKNTLLSYVENCKENNERDARTIYVRNLPPSIKEIHLKRFFSKYGKIEEVTVQVVTKLYINGISADILFESEEAAQKSLETNNMEYNGYSILVQKRNYRVWDEDDKYAVYLSLRKGVEFGPLLHAMESFGVVKYLHFCGDKFFAFVYYESVDSVELALATRKISVGKYRLSISSRKSKSKQPLQLEQQEDAGIKMKIPANEPSIQRHKHTFDDSVTITFNGYQGSKQNSNIK